MALVETATNGVVRVLASHPAAGHPALEASADLLERASAADPPVAQAELDSEPARTAVAARVTPGVYVWGCRAPASPLPERHLVLLRELGEAAEAVRRLESMDAGPGALGAGPDPTTAHLARAVALARDAVIALDGTGTVVLFNAAAGDLFGVPAGDAPGRSADALLPRTWEGGSLLDAAGTDGLPRLVKARRADGSTFWAEVWSGSMELPAEELGRLLLVRDVTDQRHRDEEREKLLHIEREQRFMAELSHMRAEFVSEVTSRLTTSFAEPEALLRRLPELAIPVIADYAVCYPPPNAPRPDGPYVAPSDPADGDGAAVPDLPAVDWGAWPQGRLIRSREDAPAGLREFVDAHVRERGARSLALLPIVESGDVRGILLLSRTSEMPEAQIRSDVELGRQLVQRAGLVLANARLYREARAAALVRDQVLAVVSHDLRNPLNVIALTTDAFLRHWPSTPREMELARNQVGVMKRAAERAKRLVRDLLDVAQIEKGSLAVHPMRNDAAVLLREAYQLHDALAERNAIRLELDVPDGLPPVEVDAERILQVLGNLLDNALRHTFPETTVRLAARVEGGRVRIEVQDQGPGIAPEDADRLFDRFSRGRHGGQGGAGLGLAIARGIVEAHGGALGFRNDDGTGATFYFTLPIAG